MSTNATCPFLASDSTRQFFTSFSTFTYFYFKPILLCLDLVGHVLCILAFYRKSKSNSLYSFQLYEVLAKCLDTVGAFFNLFFYQWFTGQGGSDGAAWFRRSYTLMWIAAKFGLSFSDMTANVKLFVMIALALDRCYALARPIDYRTLNRRKWESIAMLSSLTLGVALSFYMFFTHNALKTDGTDLYKVVQNATFTGTALIQSIVILRTAAFSVALVAVMASSLAIVILHKRRIRKVIGITANNHNTAKRLSHFSTTSDPSSETVREKFRKATDKTLFVLTMFKSCQVTNEFFIRIVHTCLTTFKTGFSSCENTWFSPIVRHMEVTVINTLDFYVLVIVNRRFRNMIKYAVSGHE